jgi:hypothetical protein
VNPLGREKLVAARDKPRNSWYDSEFGVWISDC